MAVGPRVSEWRKLPMSLTELCIDTTLRCGQAFRWRKVEDEWHCTLQGRILSLKQDATHLHYRTTWPKQTTAPGGPAAPLTPPPSSLPSPAPDQTSTPEDDEDDDDTLSLLTTYFNLPISLSALYTTWSAADPNFARRAPSFTGIRILNQPAWEALVAFICSSNNNISRISSMVTNLCLHYGPYIGTTTTTTSGSEPLHDFPSPSALAGDGVEQKLRALGFGYRARYIAQTAQIINAKGEGWLDGLRNPLSPPLGGGGGGGGGGRLPNPQPTYKAAHEALLSLPGVGPKVADCVCLMGLGWAEAVPVDTHVWQIATRDYKFGGGGKGSKTKTLNRAIHDAVGDHFRGIWGEYAGWAQSVLFTANLKSFARQAEGGGEGDGDGEEGKVEEEVKDVKEVKEVVVEVVKKEMTTGDKPTALRSTMRVTKRKVVIKTEVDEETDDMPIADVKVAATRTSKRRRVRA